MKSHNLRLVSLEEEGVQDNDHRWSPGATVLLLAVLVMGSWALVFLGLKAVHWL